MLILSLQSILVQWTFPGLMRHVLFICNKPPVYCLPRRQLYLRVFVSILSPHKDTRTRWRHQILSFIVSRAWSFLACSVPCNSSKFSDYSAEIQKMHDYFEVLWQSKIFQMRKPAEGKYSVYRDARSPHTGNTSTLWGGGIPNDHKWVEAEWRHVFHL